MHFKLVFVYSLLSTVLLIVQQLKLCKNNILSVGATRMKHIKKMEDICSIQQYGHSKCLSGYILKKFGRVGRLENESMYIINGQDVIHTSKPLKQAPWFPIHLQ